MVFCYRRFGTTYLSHLQGSRSPRRFFFDSMTFEDGTDRFPETSVTNYHTTLREIPEERRSLGAAAEA
jgi:hypothetical protein